MAPLIVFVLNSTRSTGLVVMMGHLQTYVVPVVDGEVQADLFRRFESSGIDTHDAFLFVFGRINLSRIE